MPYIPKWNISLDGDYDFQISATWRGFVGASYLYVGERETDLTLGTVPRTSVPSYTTLNLRAGAGYGLWTFTLYVKNLNDSRGIILDGTPTLNPITTKTEDNVSIITPRMIGFTISKSF